MYMGLIRANVTLKILLDLMCWPDSIFRNISDSEGSKELKWQPDSDEIYGNSLNKIEGIEGTYVTAWQ